MRVVFCTVPSVELGATIAKELVEGGLAACAQVDSAPIRSTYRWQGRTEVEEEFRMVIKTTAERIEALRVRIAELHSYTVPQIVDVAADANDAYADWLREICGD